VTGGGVFLRKGEEMGMFEMGSTVVMLFECPKTTTVLKQPGDSVKLGEALI
jgi:phosphatidylserine decarboxylase